MSVGYGTSIVVDLDFETAVAKTKEAFKEEGFGTLTEIDVKTTLKEKIGKDIDPYTILGTCNPVLADRALQAEPDIGLLLPCNVVVASRDGRTVVSALDPEVMVTVPGNDELKPIAQEASERIARALGRLSPP